jgi:hypothetical protein
MLSRACGSALKQKSEKLGRVDRPLSSMDIQEVRARGSTALKQKRQVEVLGRVDRPLSSSEEGLERVDRPLSSMEDQGLRCVDLSFLSRDVCRRSFWNCVWI